MAKNVGRRKFLKQAAVAGTAAAISPAVEAAKAVVSAPPAPAPVQDTQKAAQSAAPAPISPGYIYLSADEAAFVEAFVDVLVPADELTPSGTDLGIATFIDRQLAGAWGKGDRLYMQGPWEEGSPGQGYQLPLTPAQFFRAGITAVNEHCKGANGKSFDRLAPTDREKVVQDLDKGAIKLGSFSAKQFFDVMYQATIEGMFADPIYGGNRNKAAWQMIGYPGVIAVHATNIEKYRGKQYVVKPVSMQDLM